MNIENLSKFVKALNELPEHIKNNELDMKSNENPCGSVGCHAGLISLVDVPELKALYKSKDYSYDAWGDTLGKFLGLHNRMGLQKWAYNNPHLWKTNSGFSKKLGVFMFACPGAFNQDDFVFKHQVIIDKWNEVCELCLGAKEVNHTKLNSIILNSILDKILTKPDVSIKQK